MSHNEDPDPTLAFKKEVQAPDEAAAQQPTSNYFTRADTTPSGGPQSLEFPHIEGYTITGRLGEGGMGTVWRATQLSTRREVALKLMGARMIGSDQARRRFEREVELAASLQHPNIAQVFEAGQCQGAYYYAMRLVEGLPLDHYVRDNDLDERQIIQLTFEVCRAVEAAHRRGVIHRDLKPSNILVTADGEPHVLDFGLAKSLLDADPEHRSLVTQEGTAAGTPAFMAPEQAAGRINEIDTRSDVYALGVILYQLLTDQLPHDMRGSQFEVIRRIIEDDVRRPRQFRPQLDAELEAILLKALAKAPTDRYGGAGELADDLGRYQCGDAVQAHAPSAIYFFRKRISRYRVPIAVAAGALLCLIGGIAYYIHSIQSERDNTRTQFQRAEQQSQLAEKKTLEAQRALNVAEANEQKAKRTADSLRRALYFNHIALAEAEILAGNQQHARRLLDQCPKDLRHIEWNWLDRLMDLSVLTLNHKFVFAVGISPDGNRLASFGADQRLRLWDRHSGQQIAEVHEGSTTVYSIEYSKDGKQMLCSGLPVRIRDAQTLKVIREFPKTNARGAYFGPDETWICASTDEHKPAIWDVATGKLLYRVDERSVFHQPQLDATGDLVLTGGNQAIQLRDVRTGEVKQRILPPNGRSFSRVCLGPKGTNLGGTSIAATGEAGIWLIHTGALIHAGSPPRLLAMRQPLNAAFSPDGRLLVAACADNALRVTDIKTHQPVAVMRGHEKEIRTIVIAPDNRTIVTGGADGLVKVWDLKQQSGRRLTSFSSWCAALSHGGELVATSAPKGMTLWSARTAEPVRTLEGIQQLYRVVFSADDRYVAAAGFSGEVGVWETATGKQLWMQHHGNQTLDIHFDRGGKRLISSGHDRAVCIWDVATGQQLKRFAVRNPIYSFDLSEDEKVLLGTNGLVALWDLETGKLLRYLDPQRRRAVDRVVYSPDYHRIAGACKDGNVYIWDAVSGETQLVLGHADGVAHAIFTPDGRRIATASGGVVKLWDADTGTPLISLDGAHQNTHDMAFSLDGMRLVSVGRLGGQMLWDLSPQSDR